MKLAHPRLSYPQVYIVKYKLSATLRVTGGAHPYQGVHLFVDDTHNINH